MQCMQPLSGDFLFFFSLACTLQFGITLSHLDEWKELETIKMRSLQYFHNVCDVQISHKMLMKFTGYMHVSSRLHVIMFIS